MKYWWVSLTIIAVAALMVLFAWLLRKDRKIGMIVLVAVSSVLLVYKSIRFGLQRADHKYPIEFSHFSYFILGATMVAGVKKMRPFAGLCAFISGLAFVLAGIFSPTPMIEDAATKYSWIESTLQHETLLFGGLMIIFNTDRYNIKDVWISVIGIAVMFIFSALVYKRIIYPDLADKNHDNMIIIFVMNGTILKYLMPAGSTVPVALRVFTIIGEMILLGLILWSFYLVNNKCYDKKIKKYPDFAGNNEEYSLIALVKFIAAKVKAKKALQAGDTAVLQGGDTTAEPTQDAQPSEVTQPTADEAATPKEAAFADGEESPKTE